MRFGVRFGVLVVFAVSAFGQARLNYYEGEAAINGVVLAHNDAQATPAGTTLSTTASGRMEIYVAPDEYIRLGNQTTLQIVSTNPGDTVAKLSAGSAVVDMVRANSGPPAVTLELQDSTVRILTPGEYHFTASPPQVQVQRGEANVVRNGQTTTVRPGQALQPSANPDTTLDIWSTNRRIRLSSRLTGSKEPEQPLFGPNTDVTAGLSASVGLIPLTGLPQLMYEPIRPYRPGTQLYGPSYSYFYPYYAYPPQIRAPGPQPYRPIRPLPPGSPGGFVGGPHLPGPVIGH